MPEQHTKGPWIAKLYEPDEDDRPHWGVRQSPDAASVSVDGEALPCGFGICNIVEQDMEDVENGEERANAELIAAAPELLEACQFFVTALETGLLVRPIDKDDQSDWALKMMGFVKQLQKAQAAIAKAERSE